jgi:hypothetical protein
MARKEPERPVRKRSTPAKASSEKKLQGSNKNQRSVKETQGRAVQVDAVTTLLADPKTNPKLKALIRKKFPAKGRAKRIARAEKAWAKVMKIASTFKRLDPELIKRIAEDPDLYP